jgi:putative cardiolipin synthase
MLNRVRLKKIARTFLKIGGGFVVFFYLITAIGLKVMEVVADKNPLGDHAVVAQSKADHSIRVYDNGLASLQRRLEMINSAKKSLELEFFIYNVDSGSRLITQALLKKAKEGVAVRILVDFSLPVFQLGPAYAQMMKSEGVQVRYYNTSAFYRIVTSQHRSHRKLLIVDGETVLTGGRNIGDEYFDMHETANFLDTDVEVSGPIAKNVLGSFDMYWTSDLSREPKPVDPEDKSMEKARGFTEIDPGDEAFLALVSEKTKDSLTSTPTFTCNDLTFVTDFPNPGEKNRKVFPAISAELARAKKEVTAESPYFVIREGGMELLHDLRDRKISVTVLTNTLRSTDAGYTVASLNWNLSSLSKSGLHLYGFKALPVPGQSNRLGDTESRWGLHSKRAVLDRETTMIGTYNIDPRSANLNSELVFICRNNPAVAEFVLASIFERIRLSDEIISKDGKAHMQRLIAGASASQLTIYLALFPLANLFDFLL